MKKTIQFCSLFIVLLLFTSCFEVTEEVSVNADGSGKMKLTINLSESKQNLASYMNKEEYQGMAIPKKEDINKQFDRLREVLSKAKGISNVDYATNFEDFIFTISSEFADVDALNNAINTVADAFNPSPVPVKKEENYGYTKKSFSRYFKYPIDTEAYNQMGPLPRFVMETARMVSIYRFKQEIRDYSNKDARLSPNKKAILFESTFGDIAKKAKSIENNISF